MRVDELKIGGRYNWIGQRERLIYLGVGTGSSVGWHQFALVSEPNKVWCEVLWHEFGRHFEETNEHHQGQPCPMKQ